MMGHLKAEMPQTTDGDGVSRRCPLPGGRAPDGSGREGGLLGADAGAAFVH